MRHNRVWSYVHKNVHSEQFSPCTLVSFMSKRKKDSLHSCALHQVKLSSVCSFLYFFNTVEFNSTLKFKRKVRTGKKISFYFFPNLYAVRSPEHVQPRPQTIEEVITLHRKLLCQDKCPRAALPGVPLTQASLDPGITSGSPLILAPKAGYWWWLALLNHLPFFHVMVEFFCIIGLGLHQRTSIGSF